MAEPQPVPAAPAESEATRPAPATRTSEGLPRRDFRSRLSQWRVRAIAPRAPAPPKPKKTLTAQLREWHKRAGLFAFVFMFWLALSGVLINQSSSWGYDTVRVRWSWLMSLYGLSPEPPQNGYAAPAPGGDSHWLVATSEATLLDGEPLEYPIAAPIGFVAAGDPERPFLFAAEANRLVVLALDGTRVDELAPMLLPVKTIRRIGFVPDAGGRSRVAIQDLDIYASLDGLEWSPLPPGADVHWSQAAPLPANVREKAVPYSRPSETLEHILVDAHSGRLFGTFGVYVINAVGLAAMALSVTGVWMIWLTNRRRKAAKA